MFGAFDISTSGLIAQRTRLNAISSNIANISTIRNEDGENAPYQARFVVFETDQELQTKNGAVGVKVSSVENDDASPIARRMPDHPLADAEGNVYFPNINLTREFTDAMEATRAYEANIGVIEATKNMGRETLRILT